MGSLDSSLLPPWPMINLLIMPFGIHLKAWSQQKPKVWPNNKRCSYPGYVNSHIGGSPIYQETGVMQDEVSSWIQMEKGTWQLQYAELAKAKGITEAMANFTSSGACAAI
jgi:hypothetical protein